VTRGVVTALGVWATAVAAATGATDGGAPPKARSPFPSEAQCPALGPVPRPLPFRPGETLDFDVDALGARAGTLVLRTLPESPDGRWPVEIQVETNTFFSKMRRVSGTGVSSLDPHTLRPGHYREQSIENEVHRVADVTYGKAHEVALVSTTDGHTTTVAYRWANDLSDVVAAIPLLRSLALKPGLQVCFDAYGVRRMWRVWGKVVAREHVSLPVGEFDAWHLVGEAARLDNPELRREIHLWVSDDARRLPLAAVGSIDLGVVRATLKAWSRPSEKGGRAEHPGNLTW
jgi:Protein of unknown function (DUF3108)